jgi:multidrug resistance efflux pump
MSSFLKRGGLLMAAAALIAGPTATAQDRKGGALDGPNVINVFNPVEGRATVVSCKREGEIVKKGEVVCELDPGPLNDRLAHLSIKIRVAQTAYRNATLTREAAELAVDEYLEGGYKQELMIAEGETSLAQAQLKRAEDRMEWSDRMLQKGYISQAENIRDKLKLQRAQIGLEQAETKKTVLEKYTKAKTVSVLKSAVERTREDEAVKEAVYKQEQATRAGLLRQVERCKVVAPATGVIRYTRPFGVGAVLRDGELLYRLVPRENPAAR